MMGDAVKAQGADVCLDQQRLGMLGLPFVGKVRINLNAGNHLKSRIARQRRRQGAAAREYFQHAERRRQRAATLDGEGAAGRRTAVRCRRR